MYVAARLAERWSGDARRLKLIEVVDTLARTVKMEMISVWKPAAASEFAGERCQGYGLRIPRIRLGPDCEKRLLTLEWIDGTPLSDIKALARKGYNCRTLAATSSSPFCALRCGTGFSMPTCTREICSLTRKGADRGDFGIMGRLGSTSGAFSRKSLRLHKARLPGAWRRSISRRVMCRACPTRSRIV